MILEFYAPVKAMHGQLLGRGSKWHVRTNKFGTIYTARTGNPQQEPSAKQLAHQDKMRQAVRRYAEIAANEKELTQWQAAFASQDRYRNLRSFIIAKMMEGGN